MSVLNGLSVLVILLTTTGHWFRTQVILLSINIYLRKPLVRTGQMKQERDVLFKFVTAIFLTCKSVVMIQPVLIYVCTEVILPWATRSYLYNHQINNSFSQHSSTEILLLREACQLDQMRHVVIFVAFILTPHSFLKSLTPSNSALWQKCSLYFKQYMPTLNRAQKVLGHAGLLFKTKDLKDDNIVKLRPKVELVNTPKFFLHALMLPAHSNSQDQCVRSRRRE